MTFTTFTQFPGLKIWKILIALSFVINLIHILYQFLWSDPLLEIAEYRESVESIFKHIGYVDFTDQNMPILTIFTWILPDVIFLITVIFILISDKNATRVSRTHSNISDIEPNNMADQFSTFLSLLWIVIAGIVRPSAINSVYFITFLVVLTWLARNKKLCRSFDTFLLTFSIFVSLHILLIFTFHSYLLDFTGISANNLLQRMLGLDRFMEYNEDDLSFKVVTDLDWDKYLHLPILIITHYTVSTTGYCLRRHLKRVADQKNEQLIVMSEVRLSFLESVVNATRKISQIVKRDSKILDKKLVMMQVIKKFFVTFYIQNIHIVTNIFMMTYSIVFHSWFGFVFLMWSQMAWLIVDQRKHILRTSPLLVTYAILQLLIAYFAGMEWKSDELSLVFTDKNFDHKQLGIVFKEHLPSLPLMIRILFTLQFWMTMLIKFQEQQANEDTNKPKLAQMMDNLREDKDDNETLKKLWRIFSSFIVYSWMWFILLTMLVISLRDELMTSPKVETMISCLVFILIFIISFSLWIKFNYIFWFYTIIKSMCYLVGTYIFQFKSWDELFGIEIILSLTKYGKGELALQLSSLTVIIIMTGIQINFFHHSLMKNLSKRISENEDTENASEQKFYNNYYLESVYDIVEIIFNGLFFFVVFQVTVQSSINFISIIILIVLILQLQSNSSTFKIFIYQLISIIIAFYIKLSMLYDYQKEHNLHWFDSCCSNVTTTQVPKCLIHCENISSALEFSCCNFPNWIGLNDDREAITVEYVIIIVLVAVRVAIKYHRKGQSSPSSLKSHIKIFIDAYLKTLGRETFCALTFLLIVTRQDSVSLFYAIMLTWIALKNRESLITWKILKRIIEISLTFQCAIIFSHMILQYCQSTQKNSHDILGQLLDFVIENPLKLGQNPQWLLLEYLMLMVITKMNRETDKDQEKKFKFLQIHFEKDWKWLETIKKYFIKFHLWTTLILIFMISNTYPDVYTIGYITFVFKFLWQGSDFYLNSTVQITSDWNQLKIFNIIVFIFKFYMKVLSSYSDKIEIFDYFIFKIHATNFMRDFWIFNLIMIQGKLFKSKYLLSVIAETFITTNLLSSRGAEIFEELRLKEIRSNISNEKRNLAKFRYKMEIIRENNKKDLAPEQEPTTHTEALHSGDYDMFDDDDAESGGPATVNDEIEIDTRKNPLSENHKRVFDSQTTLEAFKTQIVAQSKFIKKTTFKILLKISEKLRSKTRKSSNVSNILKQEDDYLRSRAEVFISEQ